MSRCLKCGRENFFYMPPVAKTMALAPEEPVAEENAKIRKCQTEWCDDYRKMQNWCIVCTAWYMADQPRRPECSPQCPTCREKWYSGQVNEAIDSLGDK